MSKRLKMDQKGTLNYKNWKQKRTKREPKGRQSEPRNLHKHDLRNRVEKVMKNGGTAADFEKPCVINIEKNPYPKSSPKTITTK